MIRLFQLLTFAVLLGCCERKVYTVVITKPDESTVIGYYKTSNIRQIDINYVFFAEDSLICVPVALATIYCESKE